MWPAHFCRSSRRPAGLRLAAALLTGVLLWSGAVASIGVAIGGRAPDFRAVDQFGHEQTRATLTRRDGLVLLFFRSADW